MSVNYVHVQGRLVRDPEAKHVGNGYNLCNFTVVFSEKVKDKEETTFLDVAAWGNVALAVANSCRKGSFVDVIGKLRQEKWEKDGRKFSKISMVADVVNFNPSVPQENQEPRQSESAKAVSTPAPTEQAVSGDEPPF